jgi:hypothetical protein
MYLRRIEGVGRHKQLKGEQGSYEEKARAHRNRLRGCLGGFVVEQRN